MEDKRIIELFFERDEKAISESDKKYGTQCLRVAENILNNVQDSAECVNDTWLKAWNSIPPTIPEKLRAYLCAITRRLSVNRYNMRKAHKRGGENTVLVLEELSECVSDKADSADEYEIAAALNCFLASLKVRERQIFMRRYWLSASVSQLANDFSLSEGTVKSMLYRTRQKLKKWLEKEEIYI